MILPERSLMGLSILRTLKKTEGNPLLTKETESEPIIWDIGDKEEEYPVVNEYPSFKEEPIMFLEDESCHVYDPDHEEKESMPVYYTDIEDVIEEKEGFVGKGGIGREKDNIKDIVAVANDICSSIIQTTLSFDVDEVVKTKSHELMSFGKCIIIQENLTREDARHEFLRTSRMLPYGYSVFFSVRNIDDPIGLLPGRIILGINKRK
nr:kinesin-like protein KIN-14E [Tanacetum cinerariifolium]